MVSRNALAETPEKLHDAVQLAFAHMNDEHLANACGGGDGPLASYGVIRFEDYLLLLEGIRVEEATLAAKRRHTRIRRAEFNRTRSHLVLAMIEAGARHVCAFPGCDELEALTVDHITPLSRGGTDDLTNLQFLCRRHNSTKLDTRLTESTLG